MGRGLSELQRDIMKQATERGYVRASHALDSAYHFLEPVSSKNFRQTAKASASRALNRLVRRGLLMKHRCRYVGWPTFYHISTVEPIERDEWGRTDAEREEFFAKNRAEDERRRQEMQFKTAEDAVNELRQAFAAFAGNG
jgi:hypothetical protein